MFVLGGVIFQYFSCNHEFPQKIALFFISKPMGAMGTGIYEYLHLVDFYGHLVGKYTVRPMDPMGNACTLAVL